MNRSTTTINTRGLNTEKIKLSFKNSYRNTTKTIVGPSLVTNYVFQVVGKVKGFISISTSDMFQDEPNPQTVDMVAAVRHVETQCMEYMKANAVEFGVTAEFVEEHFQWSFAEGGEYDPTMLINIPTNNGYGRVLCRVPCVDHNGELFAVEQIPREYVCIKYKPVSVWIGKTKNDEDVCRVRWNLEQLQLCKPQIDEDIFDTNPE